ncbi:MAG: LysR substrate-binding domain-containing protein [Geminicoccaceae bacterium]
MPRPKTPTRQHFDQFFRKAGVEAPKRLIESSSLILIRGLLLGSDRLSMISAHQIVHEVNQGVVRLLDVDLDHTKRPIGITLRRDWRPTATQALLLEQLRQASRSLSADNEEAIHKLNS